MLSSGSASYKVYLHLRSYGTVMFLAVDVNECLNKLMVIVVTLLGFDFGKSS